MRRGRNLKKHWASPARRTEDSPRLLVDNPAGAVLTFRANLPGLDPVQEVGAESLEIPAQRSRQCSLLFETESQEPASVPARLHDGPGPPGWRALLAGARAGEDAGASGRETSGTTARASGRQNGRQDDCSGARRSGQRPGPEGARACRKARHPGANRRDELCGGPRRVRERARATNVFLSRGDSFRAHVCFFAGRLRCRDLAPDVAWVEEVTKIRFPPPPLLASGAPTRGIPERLAQGGAAGYTGKGVILAIIDTGIDFRNPDSFFPARACQPRDSYTSGIRRFPMLTSWAGRAANGRFLIPTEPRLAPCTTGRN